MEKLVILKRCGWVENGGYEERLNQPILKDNGLSDMQGIENKAPVINEDKLSEEQLMVFNTVALFRHNETETKTDHSLAASTNQPDSHSKEIKAMLNL